MKFKNYDELVDYCNTLDVEEEIPAPLDANLLYAKVARMNPEAIEKVTNLHIICPEPQCIKDIHSMNVIELAHDLIQSYYGEDSL